MVAGVATARRALAYNTTEFKVAPKVAPIRALDSEPHNPYGQLTPLGLVVLPSQLPSEASTPADPEGARAVSAYNSIVKAWRLSSSEAARLLGVNEQRWQFLQSIPNRSPEHGPKQLPRTDRTDSDTSSPAGSVSLSELRRIGVLANIYLTLHKLFDSENANSWVRHNVENPLFEGQTPLEAMASGGLPKMRATRRYLQALSRDW